MILFVVGVFSGIFIMIVAIAVVTRSSNKEKEVLGKTRKDEYYRALTDAYKRGAEDTASKLVEQGKVVRVNDSSAG